MPTFCLLADPDHYRADTWELIDEPDAIRYWIDSTVKVFEAALKAAEESLVTDQQRLARAIEKSRELFNEHLDQIRVDPVLHGPVTIFSLDKLARRVLTKNGLQDPFLKIKHQENVRASRHFKRLITAHDKLAPESLIRVLTEGILAGNVFDLGATETLHRYGQDNLDFFKTLDDLPGRPWLIDDYDRWQQFLIAPPKMLKRVLFFVDNAGADFVLGCLPLARYLAKRGAVVTLAANDMPSFNDMTATECRAVIKALAQDDETLRFLLQTKRMRVVGSGGKYCLLDFHKTSTRVNVAAEGTDLLIIEGMGRAVESNFNVKFTCPTLKIAMIKDPWEAKKLGGKLYDLVCKFETD